jgi:hypothetical protein
LVRKSSQQIRCCALCCCLSHLRNRLHALLFILCWLSSHGTNPYTSREEDERDRRAQHERCLCHDCLFACQQALASS